MASYSKKPSDNGQVSNYIVGLCKNAFLLDNDVCCQIALSVFEKIQCVIVFKLADYNPLSGREECFFFFWKYGEGGSARPKGWYYGTEVNSVIMWRDIFWFWVLTLEVINRANGKHLWPFKSLVFKKSPCCIQCILCWLPTEILMKMMILDF